jgi:hypothetical protein
MGKKLKLPSDSGYSGSKKCIEAMVAPVAEYVSDGNLEWSDVFCVEVFGRNLASVAVKMFSHLDYRLVF